MITLAGLPVFVGDRPVTADELQTGAVYGPDPIYDESGKQTGWRVVPATEAEIKATLANHDGVIVALSPEQRRAVAEMDSPAVEVRQK